MNNFKKEYNVINKEITIKSKIMYCYVDIVDYPPFLCSPSYEQWLYADNWKDIFEYIFDHIVSVYIPSTLEECIGLELFDGEKHDFHEAIEVYKKFGKLTENKNESLRLIVELYEQLIERKVLETIEVKRFMDILKKELFVLGIELDFEAYDNPSSARTSKNIATKEFNEKELEKNFEI